MTTSRLGPLTLWPNAAWPRAECPQCHLSTAVHPGAEAAWFVRHKAPSISDAYGRVTTPARWCAMGGQNALVALGVPAAPFLEWLSAVGPAPRHPYDV